MNENTDYRRMILAVVISGVVLVLWTYLFPQQPPPDTPANGADATVAAGADPSKPATDQEKPAEKPAVDDTPKLDPSLEKVTTLKSEKLFHLELSNFNGAMKAWSLVEGQYLINVDGAERPDRFMRPLEEADDHSAFLPPRIDLTVDQKKVVGAYAVTQDPKNGSVSFVYTDPASKVEITRTWTLDPHEYVVKGEVSVKNGGSAPVKLDLKARMAGLQNDEQATGSMFTPPIYLFESLCQEQEVFHREMITSVQSDLADPEEATRFSNGVKWSGVNNRYFMVGMVSGAEDGKLDACGFFVDPENAGLANDTKIPQGYSLAVTVAELGAGEVKPGETFSRSFRIYAGPKKYDGLNTIKPSMSEAVDFGWFTVVSIPMLKLMRMFYTWVGNWGWAIIMLTVLVKLLTLPLTQKQYKSMAGMKKIQPKMKALQEKYKDDKLKLQQEMMALYKAHNVNPLAGCLPIVLMMPIYIALYRTIYSSVELYQADLGGWIHDLSQPDPFYILPIALGAMMFIQSKLSPTAGDQAQQKIIMYLMPGIFTLMMLFLPAGLVLYIAANTIMGLIQQYWLLKKADEPAAPTQKKKARA